MKKCRSAWVVMTQTKFAATALDESINAVLLVLMIIVTVVVFMRFFRYHILKMDTEVRDVV